MLGPGDSEPLVHFSWRLLHPYMSRCMRQCLSFPAPAGLTGVLAAHQWEVGRREVKGEAAGEQREERICAW